PAPHKKPDTAPTKAEPKKPKNQSPVNPPAPEPRAPPKNERLDQFTEAGARAYNALVFGHLQRFKRYPPAAHGKTGKVVVRFVLSRTGEVTNSTVTTSSGNDILDQAALETLRRASPFPPFPADKPGAQDAYTAPISFDR